MRVRIKFSKHGVVKFIGHLDIMRYFQKAIRRAGIDVTYTTGFSPHQVMSFAAPLGVGHYSNGEYLDIEVNSHNGRQDMMDRLNGAMVPGIEIKNIVALGDNAGNAMASVAAAGPIAVILVPIVGITAWQLAAAAVTGFIAKENVVGTIAVCYAITNFIDTEELALIGSGNEVAMTMGLTKVAALAYLMFNLFTPPCFAALGAMNSEIQNTKWFWGGVGLQFATGYTIAFLVYQIGTLITTGAVGAGFTGGLIAVAAFAAIIMFIGKRAELKASK